MTRPLSIVVASCAIALAVVAGIVESALAIKQLTAAGGLSPADTVQVAVRVVVYAAGLLIADRLYAGRSWARPVLLIMFGLLWLGTLVIPMGQELAAGTGLRSVFGGDVNPLFPVVRTFHLLLVPVGLIAMCRRSASVYLADHRIRTVLPNHGDRPQ